MFRVGSTKNLTLPIIAKNFWKGFCSFKGVSKEWAFSSEERLENSVTRNLQQKGHLLFFGLTIHKRNNQVNFINGTEITSTG